MPAILSFLIIRDCHQDTPPVSGHYRMIEAMVPVTGILAGYRQTIF